MVLKGSTVFSCIHGVIISGSVVFGNIMYWCDIVDGEADQATPWFGLTESLKEYQIFAEVGF